MWGEWASHSLIHHPSSQGWAPGVLLFVVHCVGSSSDVFVINCHLHCGDAGGYLFLFTLYLSWLVCYTK